MINEERSEEVSLLKKRIRELEQLEVQRHRVEESLRESERKYKLLSEKMSDIVWIMGMDLQTVYVSPSIQKVLGFSQKERMLQTVAEQLTPDSLSLVMDTLARELTREAQGYQEPERTLTLVLEFYHKDGSTRWLETIITGIRNDQGKAIRIHGVSRDITERKRAEDDLRKHEAQHRLMIEKLPIAIFVDIRGVIVYVNEAFLTLFKLSSREEIIGKHLRNIIPPEFFDTLEKGSRIMTDKQISLPPVEVNLRRTDGVVITVFSTPMPVTFDGQTAILGALMDITERKRSEIELQKAHKLLQIQAGEIEELRVRLKEQMILDP